MKPSYASKELAKADLKPLLKRLGKGWRLIISKERLGQSVKAALTFKETLGVVPDGEKYRSTLPGALIAHGKTPEEAAKAVMAFFYKRLPGLHRQIDESHAACDALVDRAPSPFRDALRVLCGAEPPSFVRGYHSHDYTDDENQELQDWCGLNARPHWATGLSMIEAAEMIVEEAVGNANIKPEGK